jgi:hypothetical protein
MTQDPRALATAVIAVFLLERIGLRFDRVELERIDVAGRKDCSVRCSIPRERQGKYL